MSFWNGKKVLITGHTGFKGSWLSLWLSLSGAEVTGYALDPHSSKDMFVLSNISDLLSDDIRGDINDKESLNAAFNKSKPDIVFHLAAQPLVRYSYENPEYTYATNVMGTLNVMECIRKNRTKTAVMVTTDKCYENKEQVWGYREKDRLGGYDPYSSSKACMELLVSSYRNSFFYNTGQLIATARAGNVVGGGDWACDRLIPDCISAIEKNEKIIIRSPNSVRPWQHVLEPLSGYIMLAEKMCLTNNYCEAWNFGPEPSSNMNVDSIVKKLIELYGKGEYIAQPSSDIKHEAGLLTLDISKAKYILGWKPKLDFEQTMKLTADWYKNYHDTDCRVLSVKQLDFYLNL